MSRKSKIRCGGLIFRRLAGFMFIALGIALPSMSVDFTQEPSRLGSGQVTSIAFSPDGTILAAWHDADGDWQTADGELRLWDVQTQEQVGALKEDLWINTIAFSPDGTLMALGGVGNTIRLWDVAGQNQVEVMQSPTHRAVHSVAFSPDGKTLASSGANYSGENVVRLWDVQTQQQVGELKGHTQEVVYSVAFSPDGRLLFSGGGRGDEAIRVWDVQTQKQVGELIGHLDDTDALAFSPDGTILASAGGGDDMAVYLWDFQAQKQVGVLGGHSAHIGSIAFSPDGKLLASTVFWDNTVHFWDVKGQKHLGVLKGHDASDMGWFDQVTFSPDGKWLACGSENGVELWELNLPGPISRAYAYGPQPFDGTLHADTWVNLDWRPGDLAVSHDVYLGDDFEDVNTGTGDTFRGNQLSTNYIIGFTGFPYPDGLVRGSTYYWRIDEVNETEPNSPWKGPVWSFTIPPKKAYNPDPSDGDEFVDLNVELSWTAGLGAGLHTVYFGDNLDDVNNAAGGLKQVKTAYMPGLLEFAKTYYWRIDEYNTDATISKSSVWSFTVADYLLVDDFEDYDASDNEIWWAWIDGIGYASHPTLPAHPGNGTGSMVGDETTGSYMEETIVHGGGKSMPVFYDNNQQGKLKYSEVEKTLNYPRDWTENGVTTLMIWFRGISDNAAETLYVALNGSAAVYHDNPNAAQITTWTEWTIDLQVFADLGVDLTNVNTIALGLGNKNPDVSGQPGGSGTMYFDDIRLYRPAP